MKKLIVSGVVALSLVAGVASAQSYGYTTYGNSSASSGSTGSYGTCSFGNTLTIGSSGQGVRALQQYLVAQNYPGGGSWMVTGYYGQATAAAVRIFQQQHGLSATGSMNASTYSAMCGGSSSAYTYPGYPATNTAYPNTTAYPTTYPNTTTYPFSTTYPNTTYPYATYPNTATYPYTYPYQQQIAPPQPYPYNYPYSYNTPTIT